MRSDNLFLAVFLLGFMAHGTILSQDKTWYKGNLHAHSYWSDGNEFPEIIMDWYKTNGYDFTVLSDHNTLAEGEMWITLSEKEYLQEAFHDYLDHYGESWVEHQLDSTGRTKVKLKTLEEYRSLFEEDGEFLIIQSEEITSNFGDKPIHINASNIQEKISPKEGGNVAEIIQNNIDAILEQRERLNVPIMPHINHPNFGYGISADDFMQLNDVRFFEVYNGHPLVNNDGDSTHLDTESMWDLINASYLQEGKPLLYGVATDDSHNYHRFDKSYSNPGRGWVMVRADSLTASSIITAMENGDFYASTGVLLKGLETGNDSLQIEIAAEPDVGYEIQLIGKDPASDAYQIIERVKGTKASFTLPHGYGFVRAKVVSDQTNQNFFDETEYEKAWTQPIGIKKPN
ncbi:histidinol-phosphatase [Pricia sp. S334]|uniref:Histidinol-phosphatase n=1 Tax=Pricia mediterranea TaxID=3076079 RepID=A0ABU3L6J6_9FLAO|nr:histidinol-phosphatase [Pricia sp. S334]MDT7829370.1 histidinol-phosphatase [Pricia sp. S334]